MARFFRETVLVAKRGNKPRALYVALGDDFHELDWEHIGGSVRLPGEPQGKKHQFKDDKKQPPQPILLRVGDKLFVTYLDVAYDPALTDAEAAGQDVAYAVSSTGDEGPLPPIEAGDGSITVIIGTGPGAITRRLPVKTTDIVT
jgi:hypothetical protein